jgi:sialate O-acetylesterase
MKIAALFQQNSKLREVLKCAGPLALLNMRDLQGTRGLAHSRTLSRCRERLVRLSVFVFWVVAVSSSFADISLPRIFGDNMVLQQGQAVPVWGWAAPGEKVTVEFGGQKKFATTGKTGRWELKLRALKASAEPREMKISGANQITLTNILVGEVWFCSGQSNMEKPIGSQPGQRPTQNYLAELARADHPQIRLFKVGRTMSAEPLKDVKNGDWLVCNSNSLETIKFSAAAYFFGCQIQRKLNVPVGVIESSWGGTRIEPWTPPVGFESEPKLKDLALASPGTNKLVNTMPKVLFNAMVAPVAPFAIRGALWYQGESNCMGDHPDGAIYTDKMEALVRGWRKVWDEGDFPFYYVEIAPFHYFDSRTRRVPSADALPEFWEAQTRALRIQNTGMAVITDLVDNLNDIHPIQKREVGERLANLALAKTYGEKNLVCYGPMFRSAKFRDGKAEISFSAVDGGLISKDGQPLTWFTIAGAGGKSVPAKAEISGNKVIVSADSVKEPKAVRFAWDEGAQPNLFNKAGLPANPFRTDAP